MADVALTTRDRLLAAARELFTTAGYHATTTPMLARQAGVAEGTIYRHFPSKHALLNAAFQEVHQWGTAIVLAETEASGRIPDRMARLGRLWLDQAEAEPARMLLLLAWRLESELDDTSKLAARELRLGLERMIAAGKQEGSVRAGVVELWAAVWLTLVTAAVERVAAREWTAHHPHSLATLEAAWEAIAWRPITTAPPTPESAAIPPETP